MPKRVYSQYMDEATGMRFRFAREGGEGSLLHITTRHGTSIMDALNTFFGGKETTWNPINKRFETRSESHTLYWTWHASGAVLVISCFRLGDIDV